MNLITEIILPKEMLVILEIDAPIKAWPLGLRGKKIRHLTFSEKSTLDLRVHFRNYINEGQRLTMSWESFKTIAPLLSKGINFDGFMVIANSGLLSKVDLNFLISLQGLPQVNGRIELNSFYEIPNELKVNWNLPHNNSQGFFDHRLYTSQDRILPEQSLQIKEYSSNNTWIDQKIFNSLPKYRGWVFRGAQGNYSFEASLWAKQNFLNTEYYWSSSLNPAVAANFAVDAFFVIFSKNGRPIFTMSKYPKEMEVLLPSQMKLLIHNYWSEGVHFLAPELQHWLEFNNADNPDMLLDLLSGFSILRSKKRSRQFIVAEEIEFHTVRFDRTVDFAERLRQTRIACEEDLLRQNISEYCWVVCEPSRFFGFQNQCKWLSSLKPPPEFPPMPK